MKHTQFEEKLVQAQKEVVYMKMRFDKRADCEGINTVRAYYDAALAALEAIGKTP